MKQKKKTKNRSMISQVRSRLQITVNDPVQREHEQDWPAMPARVASGKRAKSLFGRRGVFGGDAAALPPRSAIRHLRSRGTEIHSRLDYDHSDRADRDDDVGETERRKRRGETDR